MSRPIGILGGTGPQGRGIALRLRRTGHDVLLGSRDAGRAAGAARDVGLPEDAGVTNQQAAERGDPVFVAVPYAGMARLLTPLAAALDGKVVVSCVNHLAFDDRGPHTPPVEAGSAAQEAAGLLPGARVVCAFNSVSAPLLLRPDHVFDEDVLVCGDDPAAVEQVVGLADEIDGLRGVPVGPLRLAATVEALTAVLIAVNTRYRTHAGVRITGVA